MSDTARRLEDSGGRLARDPHSPLLEQELRRLKWKLVGEQCASAFRAVGRAFAVLIASATEQPPHPARKLR
jgi:hypothetical protein